MLRIIEKQSKNAEPKRVKATNLKTWIAGYSR